MSWHSRPPCRSAHHRHPVIAKQDVQKLAKRKAGEQEGKNDKAGMLNSSLVVPWYRIAPDKQGILVKGYKAWRCPSKAEKAKF